MNSAHKPETDDRDDAMCENTGHAVTQIAFVAPDEDLDLPLDTRCVVVGAEEQCERLSQVQDQHVRLFLSARVAFDPDLLFVSSLAVRKYLRQHMVLIVHERMASNRQSAADRDGQDDSDLFVVGRSLALRDFTPDDEDVYTRIQTLPKDSDYKELADLVVILGIRSVGSPLTRAAAYENAGRLLIARKMQDRKAFLKTAFRAADTLHDSAGQQAEPVSQCDEVWPEAVDGCVLIDRIATLINKHVSMSSFHTTVAAFWILFAWTHRAFDILPILAALSSHKRCGKTTFLGVLALLTPNPIPVCSLSTAALYRSCEILEPTLLLDEVDTMNMRSELVNVLNAGHSRTGAQVMLATPGGGLETLSVCCPKVLAGIGELPDTIEDRSLIIKLQRKAPCDHVERWDASQLEEIKDLCRMCSRWSGDNLEQLRACKPALPHLGNDRAADNAMPLLAIAVVIGNGWPQKIADALCASYRESRRFRDFADDQERILADIQTIFTEQGVNAIASESLVESLRSLEESPWREQNLTPYRLARMLRRYGIESRCIRQGTRVCRGYFPREFGDAFSRYLQIGASFAGEECEVTEGVSP